MCLYIPIPPQRASSASRSLYLSQIFESADARRFNFLIFLFSTYQRQPLSTGISCASCGMPGHRIHGCPAAEEYVDARRVTIVNRQLHLRTGSSSAEVQPVHLTHPDWNPALTRRHGVDTRVSSSSRAHTSATQMTTASLCLP